VGQFEMLERLGMALVLPAGDRLPLQLRMALLPSGSDCDRNRPVSGPFYAQVHSLLVGGGSEMANDFDGMGDMTPSDRMRVETPSEPAIMSADERAARMDSVWQKHLAGKLVTLQEFLARRRGR
jgi:hypothetical protein